jgi:hypothetical protein
VLLTWLALAAPQGCLLAQEDPWVRGLEHPWASPAWAAWVNHCTTTTPGLTLTATRRAAGTKLVCSTRCDEPPPRALVACIRSSSTLPTSLSTSPPLPLPAHTTQHEHCPSSVPHPHPIYRRRTTRHHGHSMLCFGEGCVEFVCFFFPDLIPTVLLLVFTLVCSSTKSTLASWAARTPTRSAARIFSFCFSGIWGCNICSSCFMVPNLRARTIVGDPHHHPPLAQCIRWPLYSSLFGAAAKS